MSDSTAISVELLNGQGLYLAKAAKLLPPYRRDRPVSPSTLFRWIRDGVRLADGQRLHLEAVRIAGKFVTTREALARFLDRQSADTNAEAVPIIRSSQQRIQSQKIAAKKLASDYGID